MHESKGELKSRLQGQGLWQDFVKLREDLKAQGWAPQDAAAEAQRQIEARPGNSNDSIQVGSGDDLAAVRWVGDHISDDSIRQENAPSGTAWSLLQWTKATPANASAFWLQFWPKTLLSKAALKAEPSGWREGQGGACPTCGFPPPKPDMGTERAQQLIEEILKGNHEKLAQEDAEFASRPDAAQVGATLQTRLAGALEREKELRRRVEELERAG
jgi:hypothetical protein